MMSPEYLPSRYRPDPLPGIRMRLDPGSILLAIALIALAACSASSPSRPSPSPRSSLVPAVLARPQDLIDHDRLVGTGEEYLYDAMMQLRADLFRPRPATAGLQGEVRPAVYVNQYYQGDIDVLRSYTTNEVRDVQFVRSIDTLLRFGRAHPAGALMLRLRMP